MYQFNRSWRVAPFACFMFVAAVFPALRGMAETPAPPTAPGATYNILDYGAVGDGQTMNTDSFRKAIEACSAAGGGHVRVPAGVYLTGPIVLMSDVDLHVERGATVLFSRKLSDYPLVRTNWEGRDTYRCQSPISGDNLENVSITGQGIFDGQGDAWRMVKKTKLTQEQWDRLVASGGYVEEKKKGDITWWPNKTVAQSQEALRKLGEAKKPATEEDYAKLHDLLRPELVSLAHSRHILFEGVTFRNSPGWNVHVLEDEDLTVRHVTLFNEIYAQNGDGIDIDSCRNVFVTDSTIYAGDDDICLKSGRDEEGRKRGKPTENVTISNCDIFWGHGGVTIGSEMSGGVRNVSVSNCIMTGTDIGLRFKTTRGRGGVVENVNISNIAMHQIKGAAIFMDMYYMVRATTQPTTQASNGPTSRPSFARGGGGPGFGGFRRGRMASTQPIPDPATQPVTDATPVFRQFEIRNVTCDGAKSALEIRGLPELAISNITLEKVQITADRGITLEDAADITLRDVQVESRAEPVLSTKNVKNLSTERLSLVLKHGMSTTQPSVWVDWRQLPSSFERIDEGDQQQQDQKNSSPKQPQEAHDGGGSQEKASGEPSADAAP